MKIVYHEGPKHTKFFLFALASLREVVFRQGTAVAEAIETLALAVQAEEQGAAEVEEFFRPLNSCQC
jgi:hypothetical protein